MSGSCNFYRASNEEFLVVTLKLCEKDTKICKIATLDLSCVVTVKFMVEILQNFVAFSEYMNFRFMSFGQRVE